jgi:hypothetical protein
MSTNKTLTISRIWLVSTPFFSRFIRAKKKDKLMDLESTILNWINPPRKQIRENPQEEKTITHPMMSQSVS